MTSPVPTPLDSPGQAISKLPIETCQTMNGMWGYKIIDQTYKSDTTLIRLLVQTAGRNANLLLNIGPELRVLCLLRLSTASRRSASG